jgi:hypothetical protein
LHFSFRFQKTTSRLIFGEPGYEFGLSACYILHVGTASGAVGGRKPESAQSNPEVNE